MNLFYITRIFVVIDSKMTCDLETIKSFSVSVSGYKVTVTFEMIAIH